MADKPLPNIQQHEPLRVPEGWNHQERVLINQLEQTFDDIYRRFGRIRIEDLAKDVQTDIKESAEGVQEVRNEIAEVQNDLSTNYSTTTQTSSLIAAEVANSAYGKVNTVAITLDGVSITGTGKLDVHMTNFEVDAATGDVTIEGALTADEGSKLGNWEVTSQGILAGDPDGAYPIFLNPNPRDLGPDPDNPDYMGKGNMAFWAGDDDTYAIGNNVESLWMSKGGSIGCRTVQYIDTPYQRSSRKKKHDIVPIESCGYRLDELTPVSFKYNIDPDGQTHYGLIYEDTVDVMPEICNKTDSGDLVISYIDMIPFLLKEIKDLRARVAQLEAKEVT